MRDSTAKTDHLHRPGPESKERRDHILDAAERVFAESGFAATTMRHIAHAAGVNVATVYYHCGSKEQLFSSIYSRIVERMVALVGESLQAEADFAALVANVLDEVVQFFVEHPSIPKLLLRSGLGEIKGSGDTRRETYRPLFKMVAQEMTRRADAGEIRRVDPAKFLDGASGVIFHLALDMTQRRAPDHVITPEELKAIQEHARIFILGALGLDPRVGD